MHPSLKASAMIAALGMSASMGGVEVISNGREYRGPPVSPARAPKRRATLAKYFRSYAKRYASIASGKKSQFKGFRKVRRSWDIKLPDGSFVRTSAWVKA